MLKLPIDEYIPKILEIKEPSRVIVSTPGSGKTTRIPPALTASASGKVLCVEPRRLACVAAATRVSFEQGWTLGREVGYHVRLDKKCRSDTRLCFVTYGMLLQYLCADPFLEEYSEIIFDEFHERSIECDISLAMLRYLQKEVRSDLRLTVMSATLDADPLMDWMSPCEKIEVETPVYPLEIRYSKKSYGARLGESGDELFAQIGSVMQETRGDCLVFLPGVGEIQSCIERAQNEFGQAYEYVPCHASLPLEQQNRILNPDSVHRRIIFSTNVAESSLTVPGVTAVVDTGYAKRKFYDSVCGLSRLETLRISRDSADQRAGRAARLGPGICVRLWNDQVQNQLEPHTSPEIDHLDLSQAWLQIASWGLESPEKLDFYTAPAPGRLRDACQLLYRLGAVNSEGTVTDLGRTMSRLPLEPRLARWMSAASEEHCLKDACLMAAFLSEAPYRRASGADWQGTNLYADFVRLKKEIRKPEFSLLRRCADDILKSAESFIVGEDTASSGQNLQESLTKSMLCAYPDRLAQPRPSKEREKLSQSDPKRNILPIQALMSGNRGVILREPYELKDAKFFLCVDLNLVKGVERASNTVIKALEIRPEWIPWKEEIVSRYEPDKDRVVIAQSTHYDIFTLRETFLHEEKYRYLERETLLEAASNAPEKVFNFKSDAWNQFQARLDFLHKLEPDLDVPVFDVEWAKKLLPDFVEKCRNFEELRAVDLVPYALNSLSYELRSRLDRSAPVRIKLENGFETGVDYTSSPPVIRVRIQKAFGTYRVPRVGDGRVAVMVHLCAPSDRPVQVTQDLESFWRNTYTEVRKLLRGRYPKHEWPESPP